MLILKKKDLWQKSKWRKLHLLDYHPKLEQIIERIEYEKQNNIFQVKEWEKLLDVSININQKTVVDIGCGGGWHIAQMIELGAKKVIGIEIDREIIHRANSALSQMKYTGFEIHEIDEMLFNFIPNKSIDLVYEITVFQHLLKEITVNYFKETCKILKNDGIFIAQFLMNDLNPIKNPSNKKEGIMYYSHNEILKIAEEANLEVVKFNSYEWSDGKNSYWNLYMFKPNENALIK